MSPALQKWLSLLFGAPPGPPDDLVARSRELRIAGIDARRAALKHRRAAGATTLDRFAEISHLIRNGDGR